MSDYRESNKIKDISSISQLVSSFLVADAIIEIRDERNQQLNGIMEKNSPELEIYTPRIQKAYEEFGKLVNYRYAFMYMAKIGFEDMIRYNFEADPSIVATASTDTAHLNNMCGPNFTILSRVNLLNHTLNVFEEGLAIGKTKGRASTVSVPLLGCLFHDFGKSTKLREEIIGSTMGKGYRAHAEVSSQYITDILAVKYFKLVKEEPKNTINTLSNIVKNHHPSKGTRDIDVHFVIEADKNARKNEYNSLQKELQKKA